MHCRKWCRNHWLIFKMFWSSMMILYKMQDLRQWKHEAKVATWTRDKTKGNNVFVWKRQVQLHMFDSFWYMIAQNSHLIFQFGACNFIHKLSLLSFLPKTDCLHKCISLLPHESNATPTTVDSWSGPDLLTNIERLHSASRPRAMWRSQKNQDLNCQISVWLTWHSTKT